MDLHIQTAGFTASNSITLKPIVILGGNVNNRRLVHEYFHLWGADEHRLYPDWAPYSHYFAMTENFLLGRGNLIDTPKSYGELLGFEVEKYVKYNSPKNVFIYDEGAYPVVDYSGLAPEAIELSEDFAESAAWYVTNACELKQESPIRYNYFRDEVFGGQEYLPADGCGKG